MLHDKHRVAQVAKPLQRFQQPVVVALVQAEAWFVQHIEHARQAGTDLRGKADALALPAGQGAAGAIKVQIFKADIVEETHPLDDFLQYPLGDLALLVGQLVGKRERPLIGLIHRAADRSEEHTSELQSLMRISYAVFCLKKKKNSKE